MEEINRNNKGVINRLIQDKILTANSVAALKVALDGWHDTTIHDFTGIPDKHVGKLFTFDDVAEIAISKTSSPVALPAGPWQVRIHAYPFGDRKLVKTGACRGSMTSWDDSVSTGILSNVNLSYAQDGTDFIGPGVGGVSEPTQIMQMSPEFLTSKLKLCGMAIEVVNTTPTLTVGGLVTACNVPQPTSKTMYSSQFVCSAGPRVNQTGFVPLRLVNEPPKNLSEMVKFSPFQNKAADGCYINARMQFQDETVDCMPVAPIVIRTNLVADPAGINVPAIVPVPDAVVIAATTVYGFNSTTNWFDMDSPVIMFTGLSDTTTLTVRVRWFGQIVPDEDQNIFLRAAHPAPIYEPAFFEIYSRACGLIPAACSFTENPSGEWWKTMVSAIARAAAPLLMMVPHPVGKAAGVAAGALGEFMSSSANEKKVKRKQNNIVQKYGVGKRKDKFGQIVPVSDKTVKPRKPIPNAGPSQPR